DAHNSDSVSLELIGKGVSVVSSNIRHHGVNAQTWSAANRVNREVLCQTSDELPRSRFTPKIRRAPQARASERDGKRQGHLRHLGHSSFLECIRAWATCRPMHLKSSFRWCPHRRDTSCGLVIGGHSRMELAKA